MIFWTKFDTSYIMQKGRKLYNILICTQFFCKYFGIMYYRHKMKLEIIFICILLEYCNNFLFHDYFLIKTLVRHKALRPVHM